MTAATRPMTAREAKRYAWQRDRWADHPDFLAELDVDMQRQLSRPAPPACPAWCDEPNHDGFDDIGDGSGRQMLAHTLVIGDEVCVVVEELRAADDTVTRGAPYIHAYPDGQEMTAERAEALGRSLLAAAAKLREITGAA